MDQGQQGLSFAEERALMLPEIYRNYGILEKLHTLSGRLVDNGNFFALDDVHEIAESELYDRVLNKFPLWLEQARHRGIVA
ncbi:uncharacterized protein sS8_3625 [Methylocaldum marinum]|uniref:vWA found in TerF C terminus domain-containing protein n=1 Tax=Methylocaldum marinum TaxID=1432792 RepID=A0A250KVE7_9GAMM|nr:VWA domain-containing protein [Methylocaldum marinum]BBA35562.1 uncharacterized protein sS8_3625 [Methylocaldum marinum]